MEGRVVAARSSFGFSSGAVAANAGTIPKDPLADLRWESNSNPEIRTTAVIAKANRRDTWDRRAMGNLIERGQKGKSRGHQSKHELRAHSVEARQSKKINVGIKKVLRILPG